MVAYFLAAQMIQSMAGGGFYSTPEGLFGALVHDRKRSVLAVWSEKFTGTTQMRYYVDPFDIIDVAPRPIEELAAIPDYYRDVRAMAVKVPEGVKVLDTMGVPIESEAGKVAADIYPIYLVTSRGKESGLLKALGARQTLKPNR